MREVSSLHLEGFQEKQSPAGGCRESQASESSVIKYMFYEKA